MAREEFQYAVLQVVPRVERGERFNVGVVVYCRRRKFLGALTALDRGKLAALDPGADAAEIERHLESLVQAASGSEHGGPNARLDAQDRFGWLVAPSSTVIQPGPTHTGLTEDPEATLARLFDELVA